MLEKKFLTFQDNLYIIKRVLKEADRPIIETWKQHLRADMVLRRDGLLYFLELIPELEIIE